MHVRLIILLATLAVLPLSAPAANAAAPASVQMLSCTPWAAGEAGSVTYAARMNAVPGTARMSLRFRLFEKYGDGRFERVSAGDLGVWRKSRPGVAKYRHELTVERLHQGAVYRAVVQYRWHRADGTLIETARRTSPRCVQRGGLPNLRVASVDTRPGKVEGTAIYKVRIANRGVSTARNVGVLLRVDGQVVDEAEVIRELKPKEVKVVTFNGPVCRNRMRVIVDPYELIRESREQDNVLGPTCL